jgi:sterol desaturase/sphingolipid hydroxylase (fatty acid hydroxylase superfamily)
LEGCVEQGYLERLKSFAWDYPVLMPEESLAKVESFRRALRSGLWVSSHGTAILVASMGITLLTVGLKRYLSRKVS